jgi:hypothetical protein
MLTNILRNCGVARENSGKIYSSEILLKRKFK